MDARLNTENTKAGSVAAADTMVAGIDLHSPLLTARNVELLQALSERHQSYLRQGRGREAHAMASAMLIVWRKFTEPDIAIELPATLHQDL
jgi:hypothetical protein